MFRCVVTLLLLPCSLLNQSAAVGHSHGGNQPAGHDLRPHVHTNAAAIHDRDHVHRHDGPDGHHDHDDDPSEPATTFALQPKPLADHDADAVYVAVTDTAAKRSHGDESFAASIRWFAGASTLVAALSDRPPDRSTICAAHPPPSMGSHCPLYVRHLALLI